MSDSSPATIAGIRLDKVLYVVCILLSLSLLSALWRREVVALATTNSTSGPPRSARPAPPVPAPLPEDPVSLEGTVALGQSTAPLVALAFTDVQCPYCGTFARDIMPSLKDEYIDSGRVQFALRHLPLEQKHPQARQAAEAIECAGRQRLAWPMHDRLFIKPQQLTRLDLIDHARVLDLDNARFAACLSGEASARVDEDLKIAKALGARGTPTFFVGIRQTDGRAKLVHRIPGAVPIEQWRTPLDRLLDELGSKR